MLPPEPCDWIAKAKVSTATRQTQVEKEDVQLRIVTTHTLPHKADNYTVTPTSIFVTIQQQQQQHQNGEHYESNPPKHHEGP
jgi:hypothetical protein